MTGNPPDEGTPAPTTPNYAALIEEQKQIIVKMSEQLKALEQKSAAQEAKITALSQPAQAAQPEQLRHQERRGQGAPGPAEFNAKFSLRCAVCPDHVPGIRGADDGSPCKDN